MLYPYCSQQNKSKVSCYFTLNQNKFQNQRWILLQSSTSVIFVFRQQLFTRALFERESCSMDLSIRISPIISYCEIYSSVPVRNFPLNLMGKQSSLRSKNHQFSATESHQFLQLFVPDQWSHILF